MNPRKVTAWICAFVITVSVVSCVVLAAVRSEGVAAVTVTALDVDDEPRDHVLPFVKQKEALPDYELVVIQRNGSRHYLGTRPDESAADGLTWQLSEPVSVSLIAVVRLREKDKLISDDLAEVHVSGEPVEAGGYRFEFATERSFGIGVAAFFETPVGKAIAGAIVIGILLLIASVVPGFPDFSV